MTNTNLLELAKGKGNTSFFSWFRERLGSNTQLDPIQPIFQAGVMFETLGVHARSYQTWEIIEDFPVREPIRAGKTKTSPRLYTRQNVIDIAYWHWLRKIAESDASVLTVKQIAKRLEITPMAVIQMMGAGTMPGTGQSVTRKEFVSWLHEKIGAS